MDGGWLDVERGVVWRSIRKNLHVFRLNETSRNPVSIKFVYLKIE